MIFFVKQNYTSQKKREREKVKTKTNHCSMIIKHYIVFLSAICHIEVICLSRIFCCECINLCKKKNQRERNRRKQRKEMRHVFIKFRIRADLFNRRNDIMGFSNAPHVICSDIFSISSERFGDLAIRKAASFALLIKFS